MKRLPTVFRGRYAIKPVESNTVNVEMTQAQAEMLGIVYCLNSSCGHHPSLHHATPASISGDSQTACSLCGCKEYRQGIFIELCPLIRAQ